MPLKTLVKVGSLTNLSDARYCAGMNVQLLGFQTVGSMAGYIAPDRFQEIRGWISGPSIVAEVHGAMDRQQIDGVIEQYRPDYLELGLAELPLAAHLRLPMILRLETVDSLEGIEIMPAYLLVDAEDKRPFELPCIIHAKSVEDAKNALSDGRAGIALLGGAEMSPGLNTYDTLAPILEMLEDED